MNSAGSAQKRSGTSQSRTRGQYPNARYLLGKTAQEAAEVVVYPRRLPARGRVSPRGRLLGLLRRLPLFEDAPVDEILSIRRELDGSLIRFRDAVARFSDGMRAAGWDPEFVDDAEDVFVREVEPAV